MRHLVFPLLFLPREIVDTIVLLAGDPWTAAIFRSRYAYSRLTVCNIRRFQNLTPLVKHNCFKSLSWLCREKLENPKDVFACIIAEGSLALIERAFKLIEHPPTQNFKNGVFDVALKSCDPRKITLLLDFGYVPNEPPCLRCLNHAGSILSLLADRLPAHIIFTRDAAVAAMESDNVEFLERANARFNIKKHLGSRDAIMAARKGALRSLQWFHRQCPCEKTAYARCMFPESVYHASLQSKRDDISKWLKDETNCMLHGFGYPRLGYLNGFRYGYGDLADGSRGLFWFR